MGKKKLGIRSGLWYGINIIAALLLVLGYLSPFVRPSNLPFMSVFGLTLPLLLIVNFGFMLWWMLRKNQRFILSALVLLLGLGYIQTFVRLEKQEGVSNKTGFSVMSFNVRLFNAYDWIKDKNVGDQIVSLIKEQDPDVVCMQEFYAAKQIAFEKQYPYKHTIYRSNKNKVGQVIFSKYPFLSRGSLNFENTGNNTIYADILYKQDTIRVYNIHLESLHLRINKENLGKESSERLYGRITSSFIKQEGQLQACLQDFEKHDYKRIICADLNNGSSSYVYKKLMEGMQDSFVSRGVGFGATHEFAYFPFRIDVILAESSMKVTEFRTMQEVHLSDHYPIMATLEW
ncbi:MAG: endonuclease/exonuclease/phosphatase family protein [Flavobacteriaceae bacterium]|nr:endonuclease/exonuclease/phosphatase family protein [Flavobacteriaceae bacterium]